METNKFQLPTSNFQGFFKLYFSKILYYQSAMKRIWLVLVIIGLTTVNCYDPNLQIGIGNAFKVSSSTVYPITCEPDLQDISYHVKGLPQGARLEGDQIFIPDYLNEGTYIIRITAFINGQSTERVVALRVVHAGIQQRIVQQVEAEKIKAEKVTEIASRLESIINQHSTVLQRSAVQYTQNKFPQVQFPTGGSLDVFNPEPVNILSTQGSTSTNNRNTITSDDITLRAASQRHQNAVKAITNLLTIVDQARANHLQAQKDIEVYTIQLNNALKGQRNSQNFIIAAENKVTQIQSAIAGVQDSINQLRASINAADAKRLEFQSRKKELLDTIAGQEKIKAQLLRKLEEVNLKLAAKIAELNSKLQECQGIESQADATKTKLNKLKAKLASVIQRRKQAEKDAHNKRKKVHELKKQLAKAEQQLADAEIKLSDIKEQEKRLPKAISQVERDLKSLLGKAAKCRKQAKTLQVEINKLKNDNAEDLANQIQQIQSRILGNRKKLAVINTELAENLALIEDLKAKLNKSFPDSEFLKNQILIANEQLRILYLQGNDANTVVAHARQNVQTALRRYKKQQRIVSEATLNIEKARAQEALARLALEQLIAKYSDALPYSIVPNGNRKTEPGTPYGNNPSGSPLGPVKKNGNGASGKYIIENWTHYLSNAFGAGIHPAYPGTVTQLYPFNFLSKVEGNAVANSDGNLRGGCGGAGPIKAITGKVISIGEDSFEVELIDGSRFTINIEPCTRLSSNIKEYKIGYGADVVTKGKLKSKYSLAGTEAIFLG